MNVTVNKKYTKDEPKSYIFFSKLYNWVKANKDIYDEFELFIANSSCIEYTRLAALATLTMNQYLEDVVSIDKIALSKNAKDRATVCGNILINEIGCDFKLKNSSDIIIILSYWILQGSYYVHMLSRVDDFLNNDSIPQKLKETIANGVRSIIQCNNNHSCKIAEYSIFHLELIGRLRQPKDYLIEENNQYIYQYCKPLEVFLVSNDSKDKKRPPRYEIKNISDWVILKPNSFSDDLNVILKFVKRIDAILDKTSSNEFINTIIHLEDDYLNAIKNVIKERVGMGFESEREMITAVKNMISQLCKDNIINNLYYRQYVEDALLRYCMTLVDGNTTHKLINTKRDILLQLFASGRVRSADENNNATNPTLEDFITDEFKPRKAEIIEKVKNALRNSTKKGVAAIAVALNKLGYIEYEMKVGNINFKRLYNALKSLTDTQIGEYRTFTGNLNEVTPTDINKAIIKLTL